MQNKFASARPCNVQRPFKHLLRLSAFHAALCAILFQATASACTGSHYSTKRGLIDITTLSTAQQDDTLLMSSGSDITWYYNYGSQQSTFLDSIEFVPMLWGAYPYAGFAANVTAQIENGVNITSVIAFNEPDGCSGGGSCISPQVAATIWQLEIEPLKKSHGLKLGSPATTGSQGGIQWLREWFTACDGGCNPDFLTTHFYGDYDGITSWIGQLHSLYGDNMTDGLWLTEFALPDTDLDDTIAFFNNTINFLDGWSFVRRYSYFGAFRSDVSNIGIDAAFLTGDGKLTDIGSWYMGGNATGNVPGYLGNSSTTTSSAAMIRPGVGLARLVAICLALVGFAVVF